MHNVRLREFLALNEVDMHGQMYSSEKKLTVLVTTFNHENFLKQTLESIQIQNLEEEFQVIVFDDGSTDNSQKILLELHRSNPDQICLLLAQNNRLSRGLDSTIFALELIQTEYVALCEGDDYWESSNKLQTQLEFMEVNKEWCSISHHEVILENHADPANRKALKRDPWQTEVRVPGNKLSQGNFLFTCSVMLRRKALRDEVLRAVNGRQPGDYIIFSLAAEAGDIGFINNVYSVYRLHEQNMWQSRTLEFRTQSTLEVKWFLAGMLKSDLRFFFRETLAFEHLLRHRRFVSYAYRGIRYIRSTLLRFEEKA
jgi:glycosyltransferase involved in cell wall biosynthesis